MDKQQKDENRREKNRMMSTKKKGRRVGVQLRKSQQRCLENCRRWEKRSKH